MTAKELKYDFLLKKDRVQSLQTQNFIDAEIDWLLNEACLVFVKQRLGLSNNRREFYEMSQKRISDLSNLHVKEDKVKFLVTSPTIEVPLINLSFPYYYLLSAHAKVKNCDRSVPLKFVQSDDFTQIIKDPFNKSSKNDFLVYNFGRSSDNNGSSIYIYTTELIQQISLEYIKLPTKINQGTYLYIDGTQPQESTTDINEASHPEIVDLAVHIANLNLTSQSAEFSKVKLSIQE